MTLDGTTAGLWLVGVGSLLAAVPRLIRAPRPELGLSWESMARLVERIHAALETVGLVTVAIGSIVLAVVELGPWWFEVGAVFLAALLVYLVSAYKLRQLWLMRADTVQDEASIPSVATSAEQRRFALAHARWQACLRQAVSPTPHWPPVPSASDGQVEAGKLEPRHIAELHERDERLSDLHIPASITNDVEKLRALGCNVTVVGDLVVATMQDGRRQASVSRSSLEDKHGLLAHQKFLEDLKTLGIPVSPGPKGQPYVDL